MMRPRWGEAFALLILVSILAPGLAKGQAAADRERILEVLRKRTQLIKDVSGSYETEMSLSAEFASAYAQTFHANVSQIRELKEKRNTERFAIRLAADQLHERFLETKTFGKDGKEDSHSLIAYDGTIQYSVRNIRKPEDRFVANVTLGQDVIKQFDNSCDIAILLGLTLPTGDGTLAGNASRYRATVERVADAGVSYLQVSFEDPGTPEKNDRCRYVVQLDPEHGLAPRAITQETPTANSTDWSPWCRWTVEAFEKHAKTGLWYPTRAVKTGHGGDGSVLITTTIRLDSIRINSDLARAAFQPEIEDGSNVYEEQTKRAYVAGGKPSARVLRMLKQSAEEARREVEAANAGPTRTVPPVGNGHFGRYIVLGGLAIIAAALVWQWRASQVGA